MLIQKTGQRKLYKYKQTLLLILHVKRTFTYVSKDMAEKYGLCNSIVHSELNQTMTKSINEYID